MAILNIGGVNMPDPSSLSVVDQDLDSDSTTRNEQGQLQRDRIRQGIRKISLKWPPLVQSDAAIILSAIQPASFSVTYLDPENATTQTRTMYVGDRTNEMINTSAGYRWNISFDLIEY
jgi:hypothetical protein